MFADMTLTTWILLAFLVVLIVNALIAYRSTSQVGDVSQAQKQEMDTAEQYRDEHNAYMAETLALLKRQTAATERIANALERRGD